MNKIINWARKPWLIGGVLVAVGAMLVVSMNIQAGAKKPDMKAIKDKISAVWKKGSPAVEIIEIEASAIKGMYKVSMSRAGKHFLIYSTADGEKFISGELWRFDNNQFVNTVEEGRKGIRAEAMAKVDKKDLITFSPKGETKAALYVFTDVDCYYCQKLHQDVAKMNDLGIEIRYLAYPRAGIGSASYNKIASAWCAQDKHDAITKLKNRQNIANNVCPENPVANQYQLGQEIGLTGTPALVTESGDLIAGYMEADALAARLGLK